MSNALLLHHVQRGVGPLLDTADYHII
jgi:hypothetical protein